MFLYPRLKEQIRHAMPVTAIFTPGFADTDTTAISPIPYWTIQRAMAFTTMSQLPGVGRHTHDFINRLCGKLPVYHLALGRLVDKIPKAIAGFSKITPAPNNATNRGRHSASGKNRWSV